MNYVKENQFPILSFPDTEVTFFSVDFQNKVAQIRCSDAYLDADTGGVLLKDISIQSGVREGRACRVALYSLGRRLLQRLPRLSERPLRSGSVRVLILQRKRG